MIVLHDKNYPPLIIFELDSFLDIDFKTFKKLFDEFIEKSHKNTVKYNIAIDLYNINDYSIYSIKDIYYYFTLLTAEQLKYITRIDIYIKKNHSYLLSLLESVNTISIMPIKVLQIDYKMIW